MKASLRTVLLVALVPIWSACASLAEHHKGPDLNAPAGAEEKLDTVAAETQSGLADYKHSGIDAKAEWITCKAKDAKVAVLLVHSDRAGWDKAKVCGGWIAQAFLSQGFDVIAINRPGYGASTGQPDFGGARSLAAMDAALKDVHAKQQTKPLIGAWALETGVAPATAFAKTLGNLQFLLLGSGVYDYEDTLAKTQDEYLKKDLETIKATGGAKAFEDRSIAYDVSGLPKSIFIYHGKLDTSVPPQQAQLFADTLTSSEFKVVSQQLDGVAHQIPWQQHARVLRVLARSIVAPATGPAS